MSHTVRRAESGAVVNCNKCYPHRKLTTTSGVFRISVRRRRRRRGGMGCGLGGWVHPQKIFVLNMISLGAF